MRGQECGKSEMDLHVLPVEGKFSNRHSLEIQKKWKRRSENIDPMISIRTHSDDTTITLLTEKRQTVIFVKNEHTAHTTHISQHHKKRTDMN